MSKRTSSRIASLRIKEAERRQREEQQALEEFKDKQRRKDEREKRLLDKYRQLGKEFEYKQLMEKRKKRKRKYATSDDDEDEEYVAEDGTKKKRKDFVIQMRNLHFAADEVGKYSEDKRQIMGSTGLRLWNLQTLESRTWQRSSD